jgi:hypothetical protein
MYISDLDYLETLSYKASGVVGGQLLSNPPILGPKTGGLGPSIGGTPTIGSLGQEQQLCQSGSLVCEADSTGKIVCRIVCNFMPAGTSLSSFPGSVIRPGTPISGA